MGASIFVNGIHLGNTTDQFLRYIFPIPMDIFDFDTSQNNNLNELLSIKNASSDTEIMNWEESQQQQQQEQRKFRRLREEGANSKELEYFRTIQMQNKNNIHLEISFDPEIDTNGRFMACSGGWDWAPYSRTLDVRGLSGVLSFGIYKPVYVMEVHTSQIVHVVPKIYYLGDYPR